MNGPTGDHRTTAPPSRHFACLRRRGTQAAADPAYRHPSTRAPARPSAFSLVELVVVVVIIAVIAAIAVTRLTSVGKNSGEVALVANLATLRDAITMYSAEHDGVFPGVNDDGAGGAAGSAAAFISQLTRFSNQAGQVSSTRAGGFHFGPYLRAMPPAPVGDNKGDAGVAIDAGNSPPLVTAGTEGWVYNPGTGEIIVNTDDPNPEGSLTYDEY